MQNTTQHNSQAKQSINRASYIRFLSPPHKSLLAPLSPISSMVSKRVSDLAFCSTLLLLLAGFASSDLTKDREECSDKLVGLASCLPYVNAEAKTPSIDCCSGLKVVLDNSKKCICILIKDSNDPNLGIKLNASLAVQLPTACHTPANISHCVDLLHLAPNSFEAKVFEGFENSTKTKSSTTTPVSSDAVEKGPSSSAQEKSGGGLGKRWLVAEVVFAILPFIFMSHFFILV